MQLFRFKDYRARARACAIALYALKIKFREEPLRIVPRTRLGRKIESTKLEAPSLSAIIRTPVRFSALFGAPNKCARQALEDGAGGAVERETAGRMSAS